MVEEGTMTPFGELLEAIGTSKLPGEVFIHILIRLPALSILRFKTVCRVWLALFSLPAFARIHARIARLLSKKNAQPSSSLIIISQFIQQTDDLFSLVRVPFLGEPVKLDVPFYAKPMNMEIVGSVNGLVCLNLFRKYITIVVWNPVTRKCNFIPDPDLPVLYEESVSFGFAHDENKDCYKVIRILYSKVPETLFGFENIITREPSQFRVEVYSTKTNKWKQVEVSGDIPLLIDHKPCRNVVTGSPYWFASEPDERFPGQVLIWFDASNDSFGFRRLPLPQCEDGYGSWSVKTSLGIEGDCPVAFAYSKPNVMTDYSVALTHKIVKLNPIDEEEFVLDSSRMRCVYGFWKSDKIIALDMEWKLCLYDRNSAKLKSFPVWGDSTPGGIHVYDYTESLVLPF